MGDERSKAPTSRYDSFLASDFTDPDEARIAERIGQRLTQLGLRVWFQRPGETVPSPGERIQIARSARSAAVFLGSRAESDDEDLVSLTRAGPERVIGVILPTAPESLGPGSSLGLPITNWVDLRTGPDDRVALQNLMEVIGGRDEPFVVGDLSASVKKAAAETAGSVPALALVRPLLEAHPEYGADKAHEISLEDDPTGDFRRPAESWLLEVRRLFERSAIPLLDGRRVLFGLAILDRDVRKALTARGFLEDLEDELPDAKSHLTDFGRALVRPLPKQDADSLVDDHPARSDQLGRKEFAWSLARRLRRIHGEGKGSFMVNVHGAWGSGKSTLLDFVKKELEGAGEDGNDERWLVLDFNAWQHQHVRPPWWWLMTELYAAVRPRPWYLTLHTPRFWGALWWRHWAAVCLFGLSVALTAIPIYAWRTDLLSRFGSDEFATGASTVLALVTLLSMLWGGLRLMTTHLMHGSSRGAETGQLRAHVPMDRLTKRFKNLVRIAGRPIAIIIDDLDRCQADYVVELIEGIQTLFREATVVYIVAADREWLHDSYDSSYRDFGSTAKDPGRPLGYLFLEKMFQLSVSVPTLSEKIRDTYWSHLLGLAPEDGSGEAQTARQRAEELLENAKSEQEVFDELARQTEAPPVLQQALRSAAIRKLATPEMETKSEHFLQAFAPLLERNPRAMKRLLNAYVLERDSRLIGSERVAADPLVVERLALWTIVRMRWPRLAEQVIENPDLIPHLVEGTVPPEDAWEDLRELFTSREVRRVVVGEGVDGTLDEASMRAFAGLDAG